MASRKPKTRPISRRMQNDLLRDLSGRLDRLENEAESVAKFIKPNEQHVVIEHQLRVACGILLARLHDRIRDARLLASMIIDRSEVSA